LKTSRKSEGKLKGEKHKDKNPRSSRKLSEKTLGVNQRKDGIKKTPYPAGKTSPEGSKKVEEKQEIRHSKRIGNRTPVVKGGDRRGPQAHSFFA